jgi:hypothetical protein
VEGKLSAQKTLMFTIDKRCLPEEMRFLLGQRICINGVADSELALIWFGVFRMMGSEH